MKIKIPRYALEVIPWNSWKSNGTPSWWKAHNKVKHERDKYFNKANLKNALNALAGLYVLLIHYYKDDAVNAILVPDPSLIKVEDKYILAYSGDEGSFKIMYDL